jgi:CubicO group peptidase (beta-lactamase class C family)
MAAAPRKIRLDGSLHPDFQNVSNLFEGILERQAGGAALAVYHHGECVVDLWGGDLDSHGTPWKRDTMATSFSTTKGVTSTLIHIMADRGLINYDAKVAEYWPEFAQCGKDSITVRQVLTHQAGLYHIRQMIDDAARMNDWDHMVAAIERAEPAHIPGDRTGYHGLTYGFLAGEILQRVTGKRFSDLVQSEIVEPLGLDGMYIGAPESELHRAAELIWSKPSKAVQGMRDGAVPSWLEDAGAKASSLVSHGLGTIGFDLDIGSMMDALAPRKIAQFEFDGAETMKASIPAANGLFTARSLARMYGALARGGEIDGTRLLSRKALRRAIEPQAEAEGRSVLPIDMGWRLGYHSVPTTQGIPKKAFGHFGFGGSGAWADPTRELSVALTVNCGTGTPFGDLRIVRLGGAALATARKRDGKYVSPVARGVEEQWNKTLSWFDRSNLSSSY